MRSSVFTHFKGKMKLYETYFCLLSLNLFSDPSSHTMWPPGAKATNALACQGFEVALCNHNNGPTTVPSLATLRDKQKGTHRRKRCLQTVALSTGTFCLQYVQYVLCILQWFAGLLYIYIFPLHSNEMLLSDSVSSMQQQPTAN